MNKFIVFASARTGSTSFYNFFKDIGVNIYFEPFRPSRWKTDYSIPEQLERMFEKGTAIKHLWDHMNLTQNQILLQWACHNNIKVLYLIRQDKIYQALSRAIAFQTNIWEANQVNAEIRAKQATFEFAPISISILNDYIQLFEYAEHTYGSLVQSNDVYIMQYESYFRNNPEAVTENLKVILQFLDIPWDKWAEQIANENFDPTYKQNTIEVYRRIPNWSEIANHYHIEE